MRYTMLYRILKMFCVAFGVIFLLAACTDDPESGSSPFVQDGNDQLSNNEMADKQSTMTLSDDGLCWQADLLGLFYKPLGQMSLQVYRKLTSEDIMNLMVLAFSLWMAFQILRHVSSPTPESIGEFWTKILRKATLCFACGYLASSPENIFYVLNNFVFPIYITLLELCGNILDVINKSPEASMEHLKLSDDICETYINMSSEGGGHCRMPDVSNVNLTQASFPEEPLQLMGCMACYVGSRLDVGYKIALYAMMSGFFGFIVGIFLVAAFTITKLGFALYLVDSIFRLDMMVIVAPFLILFYPFEQTRKWTTTGFKIILNSSAIMLCLGVIVCMTILAMQRVLSGSADFGKTSAFMEFSVVPISLIFLGFLIVKSSGMAVELSDSLTGGGGGTAFQKKVAALVGTVAKAIFVIATYGAGKGVVLMIDRFERLKAIAEKVQKAKAKMQKARASMQRMAGRQNQSGGEK